MQTETVMAILMGLVWGIQLTSTFMSDKSCKPVVRNLRYAAVAIAYICVVAMVNGRYPHQLLWFGLSSSLSYVILSASVRKLLVLPLRR